MEATCTARTTAQTGVEMEALTGVTVALLTIYDMCKAVDKKMRIGEITLVKKTKSGAAQSFAIPIRQSAERDLAIAMRDFVARKRTCKREIPRRLRGSG